MPIKVIAANSVWQFHCIFAIAPSSWSHLRFHSIRAFCYFRLQLIYAFYIFRRRLASKMSVRFVSKTFSLRFRSFTRSCCYRWRIRFHFQMNWIFRISFSSFRRSMAFFVSFTTNPNQRSFHLMASSSRLLHFFSLFPANIHKLNVKQRTGDVRWCTTNGQTISKWTKRIEFRKQKSRSDRKTEDTKKNCCAIWMQITWALDDVRSRLFGILCTRNANSNNTDSIKRNCHETFDEFATNDIKNRERQHRQKRQTAKRWNARVTGTEAVHWWQNFVCHNKKSHIDWHTNKRRRTEKAFIIFSDPKWTNKYGASFASRFWTRFFPTRFSLSKRIEFHEKNFLDTDFLNCMW